MRQFSMTHTAYAGVLEDLLERYEYVVEPRGLVCYEIMNYSFVVQRPTHEPIITANLERNVLITKYTEAELDLYLTGELDASVWASKASKFWSKLANPDGTINSNYGWLALMNRSLPGDKTPWQWAIESLRADKDSRQAFVRFSLPSHQWEGNKDQVCTMHMMFMLRDDELHGTVVMRSNDVVKGLVYDMPWFCFLLDKMSDDLGVAKGMYTHIAHSMHLYEPDVALARSMLAKEQPSANLNAQLPLTESYPSRCLRCLRPVHKNRSIKLCPDCMQDERRKLNEVL